MHDAIFKREQGEEGMKKGRGEGGENPGTIYIGIVSSKFTSTWHMKDN